ncbi:fumarylacetoacetate hydrolase family protein [Anaerotignum lactatifermentans]|uniref:Fumarylacetoacetate hydrolase family protein n=1 Tax=Anaerotignum lactatifermentans TaxID=160404 RepID=A0ABS2G803_9FIRM|nr:fumarylacetoacetate hydrolase family protein [Anaerotignum lactatifermentans]MBM6829095.1 fumarylacetoacetate hydrolase family protein [Anaerotignum lactatifermentans]MBM6877297.1 fumarylacetoacetate hydrolase family protein [Anaerotignum lactatifermentans]MBM6950669.1 fumarylacetoacetate hydrolase family protein [Anaerotignum lactatifermentans]
MKVLTYIQGGSTNVGILKANGTEVVPVNYLGCEAQDMAGFLEAMTPEKQEKLEKNTELMDGIPLESVKMVSPILYPRQDVICLGINYFAHAEESARFHKEAFGGERPQPIYFSKRVNRAVGDGEPVDGHFDIVDSLDYEAELAVIIGKDAKNVSEEDAFDYVFGYTILNDISARNLQTLHKQWYFGKSLDDFTPIGPWIVTKNEFENPPALAIRSYVNGELRQDSNTSLMINGVAKVISQLSQGMTLQTGTIIAMGTPAGVGMGFEPPKFLKAGDVVTCEIEGIGKLTNEIK